MNRAAGEQRNTATPAMSSGSAQRRSGVRPTIALLRAGSSCKAFVSGVRTQPGAIALTRMPSSAYASASDFVSCATPPLLALYAGTSAPPTNDRTDAVLTIVPPPRVAAAASFGRARVAQRIV